MTAQRKSARTEPPFNDYFAIEAEGHRIGLATCRECGAVVIISTEDNGVLLHGLWHARRKRKANP